MNNFQYSFVVIVISNNNEVQQEINMVCLNSPPSMINNQILWDENVLENEFIREQDELNNWMLDQQSISVKDISKQPIHHILYFIMNKPMIWKINQLKIVVKY